MTNIIKTNFDSGLNKWLRSSAFERGWRNVLYLSSIAPVGPIVWSFLRSSPNFEFIYVNTGWIPLEWPLRKALPPPLLGHITLVLNWPTQTQLTNFDSTLENRLHLLSVRLFDTSLTIDKQNYLSEYNYSKVIAYMEYSF